MPSTWGDSAAYIDDRVAQLQSRPVTRPAYEIYVRRQATNAAAARRRQLLRLAPIYLIRAVLSICAGVAWLGYKTMWRTPPPKVDPGYALMAFMGDGRLVEMED